MYVFELVIRKYVKEFLHFCIDQTKIKIVIYIIVSDENIITFILSITFNTYTYIKFTLINSEQDKSYMFTFD